MRLADDIGISLRGALWVAIFRKSLRLLPGARAHFSAGAVMNLASSDVLALVGAAGFSYISCIFNVLRLVVIIGLLIWLMGTSSLAGVSMIFVFLPAMGWTMAKMGALRKARSEVQYLFASRIAPMCGIFIFLLSCAVGRQAT